MNKLTELSDEVPVYMLLEVHSYDQRCFSVDESEEACSLGKKHTCTISFKMLERMWLEHEAGCDVRLLLRMRGLPHIHAAARVKTWSANRRHMELQVVSAGSHFPDVLKNVKSQPCVVLGTSQGNRAWYSFFSEWSIPCHATWLHGTPWLNPWDHVACG